MIGQIIHNITLSLPQYVETELNNKKVIDLSKGNAIQLEFIEAFYVFVAYMCITHVPPLIQSHPNDDIIYCAFLIEYVWNSV